MADLPYAVVPVTENGIATTTVPSMSFGVMRDASKRTKIATLLSASG